MLKIQFPNQPYYGGPGSFQKLFSNELKKSNDFEIINPEDSDFSNYIFIVNGTKRLFWLLKCKIRGSKIILRVDGIDLNFNNVNKGVKSLLLALIRKIIVIIIANFFAQKIIYQSQFIKKQWSKFLIFKKETKVIYNGVDENFFLPKRLSQTNHIICVEGEINSPYAIKILNGIKNYKITVVGKISNEIKNKIINENVIFTGKINSKKIVEYLNSHKVYLCIEEDPPCPNSVLEAMSCDLPIFGFNSGSLNELVGYSGILTDLCVENNTPSNSSIKMLNNDLVNFFENCEKLEFNSRERVLENFTFQKIFNEYLDFIIDSK